MDSLFDKQYNRLEGIWEHASTKNKLFIYLSIYTLIFFITFLLAFSAYITDGKTFIFLGDGVLQHYPSMIYIGQYIREFIFNIAHGDFVFPLFDLGINMGGDIIGTLNGNIETDPLYILSALVPTAYSEYLYCFLAVLRLWLAGLSFSYFCFYHGKHVPHTLVGSIIYCFSTYACINVARHPYFLNPMILLPLLLVGIDKILKNKSPWMFILSLCYTAVCCGYYILYQTTIMILIYAFVRFFDVCKTHKLKQFAFAAGRGAAGYAIGVGLSAVILLPSILNFLDSARAGHSVFVPTHYSYPYLSFKILNMITPPFAGWGVLGLAAIVYFALAMLLCTHGKRTLKILLCIGIFFWIDRIGGYIMHGFQYSIDRWIYGFVLLLSYITVDMLPKLTSGSAKQKWVCAIALIVYMIIALLRPRERHIEYVLVALVFLALTIWVLSLQISANKENFAKYCSLLCIVLVVINVGVNGIYRTAPDQGNYLVYFSPWGKEVNSLLQSAEYAVQPLVKENPQGRVDGSEFSDQLVSEPFVPKMVFYDSMASVGVIEFWNSMEIRRAFSHPRFNSTQQCTIINTLLSNKYHIEPEKKNFFVPYGYIFISQAPGKRSIYENTYALPWGYTYDNAISYEEMNKLNGLQKQEAMLQAVALDTPLNSAAKLAFDTQTIPFKAVYKDCAYKKGILTVKKKNASIRLLFSLPGEAEGYLRIAGLGVVGSNPNESQVLVTCGDVIRKSAVRSKVNWYYNGESNYLFNLGYSNAERRELTITFPAAGAFTLEDIKLYALPMANYQKHVEALRTEPLENIEWSANKLTGTVDISKDKILCVSVPYSKGWSATVDGKEAKILRGNYMFMCLPLTAGHHNIELRYCSPGLKLGALLTVCSACAAFCLLFIKRKRNRERAKTEERIMQNEV